jgi:hypothetical protein
VARIFLVDTGFALAINGTHENHRTIVRPHKFMRDDAPVDFGNINDTV